MRKSQRSNILPVKKLDSYPKAWTPSPFRRDVRDATRKDSTPRQLSAALTGHLKQTLELGNGSGE
jgi:hypothetical protein